VDLCEVEAKIHEQVYLEKYMSYVNLSDDCGSLMENLLSFRRILERSLRLFIYSTIFGVVVSVVISLVYSGSISLAQVAGNFGNLVLFEVMVFFFAGSAIDISHSAKWSASMKLLKLRDKDWTVNESRMAERRALVHILTGVFLVVELLLLASFMSLV
jgi:hypothetical protein